MQHAVARYDITDTGGPKQKGVRAGILFRPWRAGDALDSLARRGSRGRGSRTACRASSGTLLDARRCTPPAWRGCTGWIAGAARTGRASFRRNTLTRFAKQTAVPGATGPATAEAGRAGSSRRVQPDDASGCRRDPTGARRRRCGKGGIKMPLPHNVAEIVVDAVDVVRAASHDRHRHEERHAARRHTLGESVHAARLVVELYLPLLLESRLRQRRHRDLVVGADPRRPLRIGQRGEPLRAPPPRLRKRNAPRHGGGNDREHHTLTAHDQPLSTGRRRSNKGHRRTSRYTRGRSRR